MKIRQFQSDRNYFLITEGEIMLGKASHEYSIIRPEIRAICLCVADFELTTFPSQFKDTKIKADEHFYLTNKDESKGIYTWEVITT